MHACKLSGLLLGLLLVGCSRSEPVASPGAAPGPVAAKAGTAAQWTMDLEKMQFPQAAATGKLQGQPFQPDRVEFQGGILKLRTGKEFFADQEVQIFLFLPAKDVGQIESKKAESSLYAPLAGRLVRFNEELLSDPSAINLDKYGSGWLFEIEAGTEAGSNTALLDPPGYIEHLTGVWEIAQRTIKGQMNE